MRRTRRADARGPLLGSILGTVITVAALASCASTNDRSGATWTALDLGPFPVGFERGWILDDQREYVSGEGIESPYGRDRPLPRPVLYQLWYPSAGNASARDAMPYGEYLALRADDAELDGFARELGAYARAIVVAELFGRGEDELDPDELAVLDEVLSTPTACVRDASPAAGAFPLVVYHSGAGSSFEDNATFAEYLASHGFVVIGSAYPRGDGRDLGIDASVDSVRDMELLQRTASRRPFVDGSRIAAGGHSLGAQTVLRWCAEPDCPLDAAFLLDTTMDYYAPSIPMHADLQAYVRERAEHLRAPLLVAAGPEAMFIFMDTLGAVERTYLTVPELAHNEFIAQGLQRLHALELRSDVDDRAPTVRANHRELCDSVRLWLDAKLLGRSSDWWARAAGYELMLPGRSGLTLESADTGETASAAWSSGSGRAPTPRQLLPLIARAGIDETRRVLQRFEDDEPQSPVYTSSMLIGSLLYDLTEVGRLDDARELYAYYRRVHQDPLSALRFLARFRARPGRMEEACHYLEVALQIDPLDARAAELLRELEGS